MSACISREGEYSDHTPGAHDFVCGRCGAFAEESAVAEVLYLREVEQALLDDRARCDERSERWRLLAMGWKHRCYTAGDALTDIAILHMQRPCSHGAEPHEPKRASNGEVWCSGPHCRTCGVLAPCPTYLLATRSGEADRP